MKITLKQFKGVSIIQGIFIILITPLYVIFFSNYITEKAENIIVCIAAITSTIFLYLSFREARKANQLKKSDLIISDFQDEIFKADKELSKPYFDVSEEQKYQFALLKNITFKKFTKDLRGFVKQIINDNDFLHCEMLLSNCDNYEFNDNTSYNQIKSLLKCLVKVNYFIANLVLKEMEYLRLLKAIDSSNIETVHKEILMKNADNIYADVIVFHYAYNRKEEFHDNINRIRLMHLENNKLIKVQPFSLNAYDETVYFVIQELRIKYINEK